MSCLMTCDDAAVPEALRPDLSLMKRQIECRTGARSIDQPGVARQRPSRRIGRLRFPGWNVSSMPGLRSIPVRT